MPIIKTKNKLVFFAHVPKCGGTTIEKTLINNNIHLSFLNPTFTKNTLWNNSSPQHIPASALAIIFKDGFFDSKFAVVRDPVSRFLSAYNHSKRHGKIEEYTNFENFLSVLESSVRKDDSYFNYMLDNHYLPASRFIPPDSKIFYLEDGLEQVFKWLENETNLNNITIAEQQNIGDYGSTHSHNSVKNKVRDVKRPRYDDLTPEQIERIRDLYKEDYHRFF